MTGIAIRRSPLGDRARQRLVSIAAGLVVAGIAAALTWLIDEQGLRRGLLGAAVAVLALWLVTTRRTQLALAGLLLYLGALDGYLKLSTGSPLVTLARDAILFAIVAGVLVRAQAQGRRLPLPPLSAWVVGFVVLVLVQFLNPQAGTLTHSLAGARQHLEFIPLFFLTFAYVRDVRALRLFVVLLLVVAAANGLAGWAQLRLTPDQFAAWGPGYAERVLGTGAFSEAGRTFAGEAGTGQVRPFGLGSDAGAGGVMGAFALGGVLALASLFTRVRYLVFAVAMAVAATTAVVTSQTRGAVACAIAVALAYGLLAATSRGRAASLVGLAAAGVVALFVVQGIVGSIGTTSLRYEGLTGGRIVATTANARGDSVAAIPDNIVHHPLGVGLGVAGPASATPGGNELVNAVDAETAPSFLVLETGIGGMLLMTAFPIVLFALAVRRCRLEPDREARMLLAAIIAPLGGIIALYPVGGGLTATTPCGPYLWAVAGIVAYWLIAKPAGARAGPAVPLP